MTRTLQLRVTALICALALMFFASACDIFKKDAGGENKEDAAQSMDFDGGEEIMVIANEYIAQDIKNLEEGIAYSNIDGEWVRIPSEYKITETSISRLALIETYDDLADYPIEVYALEYKLKPDNRDKVILAGSMILSEDGWLTSMDAKPYLIVKRAEAPELLGTIDETALSEAGGDMKTAVAPYTKLGDAEKYMDYFAKHTQILPLMANYTDGTFSDSALLDFALLNMDGYTYEEGVTAEQIDETLMKYFGKTVSEYVPKTNVTEYVPESGKEKIRATGQPYDFTDYMLLDSLTVNADASISARFDRYTISADSAEKNPKSDLLMGKLDGYVKADTLELNFYEKTDENGEMYIEYISLKKVLSQQEGPLSSNEYDTREKVALQELVLSNGVRLGMAYDEVEKLVGGFDDVYNNTDGVRSCAKLGYYYGFNVINESFTAEQAGDLPRDGVLYLTSVSAQDGCIDELPRGIKIGDSIESVIDKIPARDTKLKEWKYQSLYGPYNYSPDESLAYMEFSSKLQTYRIIIQPEGYGVINMSFDEENKLISFDMMYE